MRVTKPAGPREGRRLGRVLFGAVGFLAIAIGVLLVTRLISKRAPGAASGSQSSTRTVPLEPARAPREILSASAPASAGQFPSRAQPGVFASRGVFAPWGGASLDQVGRSRPPEGSAMGPMSFAVDGAGRLYVLDEVNGRVVRRSADGRAEAAIPIDLRTPEDIAVASDGTLAVLDRHAKKQVALYDESGAPRGKLPLGGEGVPEPGEVTGVFVDGSDVYVERAHERLVKLGDTRGTPARPRSELAGRPTRDGSALLSAAISDAKAGRVRVSSIERASGKPRFTRELQLWPVLRAILLLEADGAGTIYFGAEAQRPGAQPAVILSCLDPITGAVVGGAVLPANTLPEESFRDFVVLESGGVIQSLRSETGVTYRRYDCR